MAQILVVEYEESLLQTLRFNLSRAGHEVRLSTNGLQALDMIRGNPPELVVLDLMLPGMDGLDLCRAVRAETTNPSVAHMPILILTARDEEIDKVVGLEVGADVRWLRGKIEPDPTTPRRIQTVRGIGYVFQE